MNDSHLHSATAVDPHPHDIDHLIDHAAHLLPSQGPITVFVHHNTLHAFEHLPFDQAVIEGRHTYGCQPYLAEDLYRREVARGRIRQQDLSEVLLDDLGEDSDFLIGFMGTRYHLRLAMLEHSFRQGTDTELRWLMAETDALDCFRPEAPPQFRQSVINHTRACLLHNQQEAARDTSKRQDGIASLLRRFGSVPERWSDRTWESFTLHWLWRVCHNGVHGLKRTGVEPPPRVRHRDLLLQATGRDIDLMVDPILYRFCAAYLDQGFATWTLPNRDAGLFESFSTLYRDAHPAERWLAALPEQLRDMETRGIGAEASIQESLHALGVSPGEKQAYITQTLLALRGWAGMIWQMETNAEWAARPAPHGTLKHYLALRLLLERLALESVAGESLAQPVPVRELRDTLRHLIPHPPRVSVDQRAFLVFQLAQVRGWSPDELHRMSRDDWSRLITEIETFDSLQRRRIYHLAFERKYRVAALDAIALHAGSQATRDPAHDRSAPARPCFQLVTCIDDREESLRRHLEEIEPACQTFGVAGFYGVVMYYRGASDAHYRPLCPVVVKPQHYVRETACYSLTSASQQRAETRRLLGAATHRWNVSSRSLLGGILTTMLGSLASIPLLTRVLFPHLTARVRRAVGTFVEPPPVTELQIVRLEEPPGPADENLGFSQNEMCAIVERVLSDIGLLGGFSRLVVFFGHGSGSLNNPHESAYNCGACSGGRGGANARAFALMANDPLVRAQLVRAGLQIPDDTWFLGAYHNTCNEDVVYYDLDRLPRSHRRDFEEARDRIDQARDRNAHERCRRFESAPLNLTPHEALEHVQTRAEDLSQARPEYNHATNSLCLVGRRDWSRGLFLDRRAFLTSYDPTLDDENATILARILGAVIPVCAGISLEYYFSRVDEMGYGCGSKLPHNITSLLGVVEGASGDLRPGLSRQMTEIHEPLRILFIIETTPQAMISIMERNATINCLVRNQWVQLATLDPETREIHVYQRGGFQLYHPESSDLPSIAGSPDWYRGLRDHLDFAAIRPADLSHPSLVQNLQS